MDEIGRCLHRQPFQLLVVPSICLWLNVYLCIIVVMVMVVVVVMVVVCMRRVFILWLSARPSVRPSGHPHTTANNGEHGTYDRCVDDDTYIHVYTVNTRREK